MANFKGISGQHLAMAEATAKGYNISVTEETGNTYSMYDFIIDDGINLWKVEVKTSDYLHHKYNKNDNKVVYKVKRQNGLSYNVDVFAFVCTQIQKIAWIPAKNITTVRKIIYYKDFAQYCLPDNHKFLKELSDKAYSMANITKIASDVKKYSTSQLTLFNKESNDG